MRQYESFSVSSQDRSIIVDALSRIVSKIASLCPGGRLPDSYLVIDLETSGFNHSPAPGKKPDVIVQVGTAAVQNRQLVDNMAVYIKRPPGTMTEGATKATGITDEILQERGVEPAEFYPKLLALLQLYQSAHVMFMGHNMVAFDRPFLNADLRRHGYDFEVAPGEFIDTGMMFKAAQMQHAPSDAEDLTAFFDRIRETRSRARWNLTLATQMLGVDRKHGLDMSKAHDAGFDCLATHLLYEELRSVAGM